MPDPSLTCHTGLGIKPGSQSSQDAAEPIAPQQKFHFLLFLIITKTSRVGRELCAFGPLSHLFLMICLWGKFPDQEARPLSSQARCESSAVFFQNLCSQPRVVLPTPSPPSPYSRPGKLGNVWGYFGGTFKNGEAPGPRNAKCSTVNRMNRTAL